MTFDSSSTPELPPIPHMPFTSMTPPPDGCARYFILGISFFSPVPVGLIVGLYYLNKPDFQNREFGKQVLKASSMIFVMLCLCLVLAVVAIGIGGLSTISN